MLTIISLDRDAVAVLLSDGTRWTVSRDDTWAVSPWLPAHHVTLHGTGVYRRMENLVTDSAAEVILDTSTSIPFTYRYAC